MSYLRAVFWVSLAYITWGFSPFFWKLLSHVPALEIMVHRVIWSVVFLAPLLLKKKKLAEVKRVLFSDRNSLTLLCVASFLIVYNWYNFVLAMTTHQILQSSLAYFITPLMSIALGLVILKERMNRWQTIAVSLATGAVIYMMLAKGVVPNLALILAITFSLYGLLKKKIGVSGDLGIFIETLLATPFVLVPLILWGHWNHSLSTWVFLVLSGPVTAIPLVWFAWGVQRLPLIAIGLLQFISPFLQFCVAVYFYGEPFDAIHQHAFALIWIALGFFTFDLLRRTQKRKVKEST